MKAARKGGKGKARSGTGTGTGTKTATGTGTRTRTATGKRGRDRDRDHGHGHEHGHEHEHGHGHGHGHEHHGKERDIFGNPADLKRYIARLEAPDRVEWQRPDEVLKALGLRRGQVVAEIGAGVGYFTLRLAKALGARGKVYAVDVAPEILAALRERLAKAKAANVRLALARQDDPGLPTRGCDLVLVVNTFHHFPHLVPYMKTLARALRPGGRLVNIDFHERDLPVGPPPGHKLSRKDFLAAARKAGFALVEEHDFLPYQYFLVLET